MTDFLFLNLSVLKYFTLIPVLGIIVFFCKDKDIRAYRQKPHRTNFAVNGFSIKTAAH